jgi:hypothetical protein
MISHVVTIILRQTSNRAFRIKTGVIAGPERA